MYSLYKKLTFLEVEKLCLSCNSPQQERKLRRRKKLIYGGDKSKTTEGKKVGWLAAWLAVGLAGWLAAGLAGGLGG